MTKRVAFGTLFLLACAADRSGLAPGSNLEPAEDSGITYGSEIPEVSPRQRPTENGLGDAATANADAAVLPQQDGGLVPDEDSGSSPVEDAGAPWPYTMMCEDCYDHSDCGAGYVCYSSTCYMLDEGMACWEGFDHYGLSPYGLYVDKNTTYSVCKPNGSCEVWNEKYAELK